MEYVYVITNTVTGEQYIGSTWRPESRWYQHRCKLRIGKHHTAKLQEAWNRYGESVFRFDVIDEVSDWRYVKHVEHWYVRTMQPAYNSNRDISGLPLSPDEARQRIAADNENWKRVHGGAS